MTKPIFMLVCHVSHIHMQYSMAEKKKIAELLHLEEKRIPAFLLLSNGYLHHPRCAWHDSYCLRYHTSLITLSYHLNDTVPVSYDTGFAVDNDDAENSEKRR